MILLDYLKFYGAEIARSELSLGSLAELGVIQRAVANFMNLKL